MADPWGSYFDVNHAKLWGEPCFLEQSQKYLF